MEDWEKFILVFIYIMSFILILGMAGAFAKEDSNELENNCIECENKICCEVGD